MGTLTRIRIIRDTPPTKKRMVPLALDLDFDGKHFKLCPVVIMVDVTGNTNNGIGPMLLVVGKILIGEVSYTLAYQCLIDTN